MASPAPRTSSEHLNTTSASGDCIVVSADKAEETNNTTPAPRANMDSARSSIGASSEQSTPPTSLGDMSSELDASKEDAAAQSGRRSNRPRTSVGTYNDKVNAGTAVHTRTSFLPRDENGAPISRTVSGVTLVNNSTDELAEKTLEDGVKGSKMDRNVNSKSAEPSLKASVQASSVHAYDKIQRKRSKRRGQLENAANSVAGAVSNATSALGKRTRDVMETAKEKLLDSRGSLKAHFPDGNDGTLESAPKRMFPNLKVHHEKAQEQPRPNNVGHRRKKYLAHGLYVGQHRHFNPKLTESKNKMQRLSKGATRENPVLPLPMFLGEELLKRDRDFVMPFEILNPLPRDESPKEWRQLSKNRFIGDAYASWKKVNATLDSSYCECKSTTGGCTESCINRTMQYECNDSNCRLGPACGNRAFAELKFRGMNKNFSRRKEDVKPDQNLWGEGVEVLKTKDRGYGVRAMRSFTPGQIIVEYCGEIITQDECDRRMNEDYKEKTDYYLMTFHDKMIIDATRGSIARFVNHSCDPNCRVEKWTVDGEPRMALFAGDNGIVTSEELTYDYNFEAFSKSNVQQCLCGAANCRGVLGPKTTIPTKDRVMAKTVEVVRGIKRKTKRFFSAEDSSSDEESQPKRRKTASDPKALLYKVKNQITNITSSLQPAIQPSNNDDLDLQKMSREERASKRNPSLLDPRSHRERKKLTKRRTASSSLTVSELSHATARINAKKANRHSMPMSASSSAAISTHVSPKPNILQNAKGSIQKGGNAIKSAMSKPPERRRTWMGAAIEPPPDESNPLARLLGANNSSSSTRQSKPSFRKHGTWTYALPEPTEEDKMRDIAEGKTSIPRRRSSLAPARPASSIRPTTAQSVAKSVKGFAVKSIHGTERAAAMARLGLQGDQAMMKTIRHVSGAE